MQIVTPWWLIFLLLAGIEKNGLIWFAVNSHLYALIEFERFACVISNFTFSNELQYFEKKLDQYGNLTRAAIELAKDWRTDRMLRRLEALLVVADESQSLLISGTGDVIEPEHDILAIGSGGAYCQAAARALLDNTELDARGIVEKSLSIAGDICVYTNNEITIEEL